MITYAIFFSLCGLIKILFLWRRSSWRITQKPKLHHLKRPNWPSIRPTKDYWLYLIACEKGKYYVGITKNLKRRRSEQFSGGNSCPVWMKRHRPKRYVGVLRLGVRSRKKAESMETELTEHLWRRFGRRNVRGGKHTSIKLAKKSHMK
ncbi:MAG: GIY-YIG nuclease family protein [Pseudobacteriovorax sp.]|nr:GIY-YIG nuclease family protein [Pseudobacteriovorax sp.]